MNSIKLKDVQNIEETVSLIQSGEHCLVFEQNSDLETRQKRKEYFLKNAFGGKIVLNTLIILSLISIALCCLSLWFLFLAIPVGLFTMFLILMFSNTKYGFKLDYFPGTFTIKNNSLSFRDINNSQIFIESSVFAIAPQMITNIKVNPDGSGDIDFDSHYLTEGKVPDGKWAWTQVPEVAKVKAIIETLTES